MQQNATEAYQLHYTPEVNAVIVSTPEGEHVAAVRKALELGKPVMVEKHIALTLGDADDILSTLKSTGGKLRIGYSRRFKRCYLLAKEQLVKGRLGKVTGVSARIYNSRAQVFQMLDRNPGATPIVDSLTYYIDMLGWFLEGNPVVEVWARGKAGIIREAGYACDDVTYAVLTLADGALVNLAVSFALPALANRAWQAARPEGSARPAIIGGTWWSVARLLLSLFMMSAIPLAAAGYKLHDPGRYQVMNNDFSSQIAAFKAAGAEIVTGNMIPPDFATFWSQCAQQGFKPKVVTIGKALLFPSVINSLGARGNGLTSEVWWTPSHPFKSGLTGQSAAQLAKAYEEATKRPWSQPIGFQHALFEVAIDVLKRTKSLEPKAILESIIATNYQSMVGPVQWTGKPVKNVTKTPLVAGQWQRKGDKFELVITANKPAPNIPTGGKLELLS